MTDDILDLTDNKKYLDLMPESQRDPEALAKAKFNADAHIKNLEMRLDELRQDYLKVSADSQTRAKLEDLIRQMEGKQQLSRESQLASSEQPSAKEVQEKPTIDFNEVDRHLANRLQQYEVEKKHAENAAFVKNKLKERFGDNYSDSVNQQITDLGLTAEDFNALARKSPAALLKTLGVDNIPRETYQAPPRGSSGFNPKIEPKKTWAYFQKLKQENPNLYRDPKTTNEMTAAALELGEAFMDGDFKRYGDGVA
jgi:hypothetical protein